MQNNKCRRSKTAQNSQCRRYKTTSVIWDDQTVGISLRQPTEALSPKLVGDGSTAISPSIGLNYFGSGGRFKVGSLLVAVWNCTSGYANHTELPHFKFRFLTSGVFDPSLPLSSFPLKSIWVLHRSFIVFSLPPKLSNFP